MSSEKGKGRAINLDDTHNLPVPDPSPPSSSSILERVTASATGLAHSAFAAPTNNELSNAASTALTNTGKGLQWSGSSGSSWAESSSQCQQTRFPTLQGQPLSSFRASHRDEHIKEVESEFSSFLNGIESFTPSEPYRQTDFQGKVIEQQLGVSNSRTNTSGGQARQNSYSTVDEQQQHDGDAVLSILLHPTSANDEVEALQLEEEAVDFILTDNQVSQLRILADELFPPIDQHISMPAEHPLNLVPPMVSTVTTLHCLPFTDTKVEESYLYFGRDIPRDTARQMWMNQWEGVLSRYTDEVWGNLLPLVTEARREINMLKENPPGTPVERSNALRRLGMLLGHVRKSQTHQ